MRVCGMAQTVCIIRTEDEKAWFRAISQIALSRSSTSSAPELSSSPLSVCLCSTSPTRPVSLDPPSGAGNRARWRMN